MLRFVSFFTASLQRRAWFLLTPLVLLFFLVLVYLLEGSFKRSMISGVEAQLAIQVRLLLADVESDGTSAFQVLAVQEPELKSPSGNLFAMAVDSSGKLLWQSPSLDYSGIQPSTLLGNAHQASMGETRFDELPGGGFRLVKTIAFDLETFNDPENNEGKAVSLSELIHVVFVDTGNVVSQQVGVFRQTLVLSLSAALVIFIVFQFLLLRWLFRPLHELGQELGQIENAEKSRFENAYPQEVAPLTGQLNRFIDAEREQRQRYSNTLSDLAHSLKTPLAAIRSSMTAKGVQRSTDSDITEQLDRMEQIVAHQLRRSSVVGASLSSVNSDISVVAERLIVALQKVYAGKAVVVDNQLPRGLTVTMPEDDLFEVLGNLLDNAFKYCRANICLHDDASCFDGSVKIRIENDGELRSEAECKALLRRGVRLDESKPGQGLGLSVAESIVAAYGGALVIEPVSGGGVRVVLSFS